MARPTQPLVWYQLRFALPLGQDTAVGLVERILADGSLGRVVLELRASGGQAVWAVGSSAGERLVSVVRELVPGCRVNAGFSRRAVSQAVVVSARPVGAGLATERLTTVVRAVLAALASTAEDEELVVQLQLGRRFAPQVLGRVEPQGWLEMLGLVPIPSLSGERGRRMRAQVGRHRAAVCLRLGVRAASPLRQRTLLQGLLGALRLVEGPGVRLRARTENPAKLDGVRRPWRAGLELGAGEIVAMVGWPIGELPLPLLGSGHPRQIAPPPEVVSGSSQRVVGASAVPGREELVRLPIADAVYHTHLLGPTGVGKSTVLLSLALADAAEGRGLLLLDPKGDLATDFVARLPEERAGDVVVMDPTNPCPVGFNPLVGPPGLAVVTAEAVLGVLAELFRDSWGIRTAFWQGYEAKPVRTQAVEVAPVLNKLRQLMLRPGLRAMLGQAQPRFGLTDLLERRRIVVVNLNQGLLGAGAARLLGTLLVSQLWQHLLARQAEPPERRQIVSVYIDEVQAFLTGLPGSLADALAQARSLGAAFHLAHQYRGQLSTEMMQAVETNTRSKVYFALSATDAAAAARLAPELEAADFQLLAQYQAYATVMHQGHRSGWFSLATRPAPPAVRDPALLYAASHARYGIPAKQTEADLIALTSASTTTTVDVNEQRNPTTALSDTTPGTSDVTGDVTSGGPGDEAAGELTPDAALDEAVLDGTSNGTEAEADGSTSGTKSGHRRPAIGRRRRP